MTSLATDRLSGLTTAVAVKAPCRLKTTANHALSGLAMVDGVTPAEGDRILAGSQTDTTANGIWNASATAWTRAKDFDGTRDAVGGTQTLVTSGATNGNSYWRVDGDGEVVIGTDAITFSPAFIDDSASATYVPAGASAQSTTVQAKLRRTLGISPTDYPNLFTGASTRAIATVTESGGLAYTWTRYQQDPIVIDSGVYGAVATTGSESLPSMIVHGRVPGTVTLDRSNKTDYFYQKAGGLVQSDVRGLMVLGGKGFLRHSLATDNVQGFQVYEDLVLLGFTESGISSDSNNIPYWKLNRVVFRGADDSIGFALTGYYDASSILDSEFHNGKYGLKVVGDRSSTLSVERTSFFTIRPGDDNSVNPDKEADVWIGPSPTFVASGAGSIFSNIRWGPENMSLNKPRMLFADEDTISGTHVGNRSHKTTASTGYIDGLAILDSCIFGNASITAPFIQSYTPNVSRFRFEGNYTGSPHTYLIQYTPAEAAEDTYITRRNYVRIMPPSPGERPFQTAVSNRAIGVIEDPFGVMQDDSHIQLNGPGDDLSYTLLARVQGKDGNVGGGPTKATVASAFKGNPNAAEVTFAANGGRTICWYYDLGAITPNTLARLHLHLKSGATLPLTQIGYELYNTASTKSAIFGTALLNATKDPDGVRLDIPWIGHVGDTGSWRLVIYALDYLAATRTKVQIGTLSVYHSRTWMNVGHLRTISTGAWDDGHVLVGANHLWFDSGNVYANTAAPTTATDGTRLNLAAMTAQADTVAADLAALKVDFNALLAKLRSSGRLSP